ncbi:MAG TPA: AmmeMemoRadiSam system protein A [Nitrospirae bacterium]|nr:AmmeMemoRadiSam system protein A [Nitrospirota bacterium]
MHPIVKLAKHAVEMFIIQGRNVSAHELHGEDVDRKAGVFVSLKKNGELRGCIGTYAPTTENITAEVIQNAISSATQDPRFPPVAAGELAELEYSVDVLSPPERVDSPESLDPQRYGIIVKKGGRSGLLLPDLEGVDTVGQQIKIAAGKAGINSTDGMELFRFEVKRYK